MISYTETKESIEKFLDKPEYNGKALAISGEWGVGKTHLINSIKEERTLRIKKHIQDNEETIKNDYYIDEKIEKLKKEFKVLNEKRNIIHISIIGVETTTEFKRKLYTNYLLNEDIQNETNNQITKSLKTFAKEGIKILGKASGIGNELANITEAILELSILMKIKGKVIVIDDIERKSDKFQIDALMGIIEQLKEFNKIILLINERELKSENWFNLKEKIIDEYISLQINTEDCLNIVCPQEYIPEKREVLKQIFNDLKISNLRVCHKIFSKMDTLIDKTLGRETNSNINIVSNLFVTIGKIIFLKNMGGDYFKQLISQIDYYSLQRQLKKTHPNNITEKDKERFKILEKEIEKIQYPISSTQNYFDISLLLLLENDLKNINNTMIFLDFEKIKLFIQETFETLNARANLRELFLFHDDVQKGKFNTAEIFLKYQHLLQKDISPDFEISHFLNLYKTFSLYQLNVKPLKIMIKRNYIKYGIGTHYVHEGILGKFTDVIFYRERRRLLTSSFDEIFRRESFLTDEHYKIINKFTKNDIAVLLEKGDIYENIITAKLLIEKNENTTLCQKILSVLIQIKNERIDSKIYHICKANAVFKIVEKSQL